jgi:hypothetical protein
MVCEEYCQRYPLLVWTSALLFVYSKKEKVLVYFVRG